MNRMAKTPIGLAMASMVLSASAEVFQRWSYDEVAGKALHECLNSGTVGTKWNWEDTAKFATDGNGWLPTGPVGMLNSLEAGHRP